MSLHEYWLTERFHKNKRQRHAGQASLAVSQDTMHLAEGWLPTHETGEYNVMECYREQACVQWLLLSLTHVCLKQV